MLSAITSFLRALSGEPPISAAAASRTAPVSAAPELDTSDTETAFIRIEEKPTERLVLVKFLNIDPGKGVELRHGGSIALSRLASGEFHRVYAITDRTIFSIADQTAGDMG